MFADVNNEPKKQSGSSSNLPKIILAGNGNAIPKILATAINQCLQNTIQEISIE